MPFGAGGSSAPGSSEVPEMAEPSKTEQRKAEHVNIILQENVSAEYNYWNDVRLVHTALPELDLDDIEVSVTFFGKRLGAPLIISSMTGGFGMGKEINANLAKGAAEGGVAMDGGWQPACREFARSCPDTQSGRREGDRRGRARGDVVLRGRALPREEGGREPEGAPGRDVLELGDPDPRLDSVGRCRPAARRHGRRAERPRCRPMTLTRRHDGGQGEADARARAGQRAPG